MKYRHIIYVVNLFMFFFAGIQICMAAFSFKILVVGDSSQTSMEKTVADAQKILIDLRTEGRLKSVSGLDTGFKRLDYNNASERETCERLGIGKESLPLLAVVSLDAQGGPVKLLWKSQIGDVGESISALMAYLGITDYVVNKPAQPPDTSKASVEKDDYDKIIDDCTKTLVSNPNDADAYFNRGKANFNKKVFGSAIEDFTKAISINPNDADAYCGRGRAYLRRGTRDKIKEDIKNAIEDFTKAISLNPKHALAYNGRGSSSQELLDLTFVQNSYKKYYKPLEDFTKAIEIDQNFAVAYLNRGLYHLYNSPSSNYNYFADESSEIISAIEDFTKVISINPNDFDTAKYRWANAFTKNYYENIIARAYLCRGLAHYHGKKDYKRAIADLRKFIEIASYAPSGYEESIEEAKQVIKEIEELLPDNK